MATKSIVDTDSYPERPLKDAKASPESIVEAEGRPEKDQIEDYHQTHPTLNAKDIVAPEPESEVGPVIEQDTPDFTGEPEGDEG